MRTIRAPYLRIASAVVASLASATSLAQTAPAAKSGDFSVQRFEPAPGTKNFLSVEGLRMDGGWGWTAGLSFNYSKNPFVLVSCASQTDCKSPNATQKNDIPVVSDMYTADVLASVSPVRRLQLGLRLPLTYVNGSGIEPSTGSSLPQGLKKFGLGDVMLEGKVRFFGTATDPVVLGGAADVSFPTGHATAPGAYLGNDSPVTGGLRLILDANIKRWSFGANLRGVARAPGTLGTTKVGPVDLRYGAAAAFALTPVFRILGEGFGSTQFSTKNGTNTLEFDGAFEAKPLNWPVSFRLGGGAGVLAGVGVPAGRAFGMIVFSHEKVDTDGDGIYDDVDKCPTVPEDFDGFEDGDGCPEDDNDGDHIPDSVDKCPNMPETLNGLDDTDGCPDAVSDRDGDGVPDSEDKCPDAPGKMHSKQYNGCPDRDNDGIPDHLDKCPDQPEDTDGFQDEDGCPDPDNDNDGIPDEQDECIDQPETMNGYKDEDGCPDVAPDRDHDGIPDNKDKCPDKPENYNGFEDEDGCPDKGPNLVQVSDSGIKILQRIEFATGRDQINGKNSFAVLDAVAGAMKGHVEITLLEVAGHTDNAGSAADNRTLSQKRADAVVAYLVSKGVPAKRLVAKGYGPDKPLGDNKTAAGKQKNRRVEFNNVSSAKAAATTAPAAVPTVTAPAALAAPAAVPKKP